MTSNEFTNIYWRQYISLEKEFTSTIHYVSLDKINADSYSQAYSKLLLEIGSEVAVVLKEYCQEIDPEFDDSHDCIDYLKKSITKCNTDFISQIVDVKNTDQKIQPWGEWTTKKAPFWWTAYNKVKHSRTSLVIIDGVEQEGYKFANQRYTLLALAGLYQIMVFFYHKIATDEGQWIVTPMPGSRLFELASGMWAGINFYGDDAFRIVEESGCLEWVTSSVPY